MTDALKWTLFASGLLVLIVGMSFYIYTLKKIKKIRKQMDSVTLDLIEQDKNLQGIENILNRKDHGELIWDFYDYEKSQGFMLIEPSVLELAINTTLRNDYQDILVINDKNGFSAINLKAKTERNVCVDGDVNWEVINQNSEKYISKPINKQSANSQFDLVLIQGNKLKIKEIFENSFVKLKESGIIIIDKSREQDKNENLELRNLIKFLSHSQIRHEITKFANNCIVIAK